MQNLGKARLTDLPRLEGRAGELLTKNPPALPSGSKRLYEVALIEVSTAHSL
jgi:hypothetical protein